MAAAAGQHNANIPHGIDTLGDRIAGQRDIANKLVLLCDHLPAALIAPAEAAGNPQRERITEATDAIKAAVRFWGRTEVALTNQLRGQTVIPISTPLPNFGNNAALPNEREVRIPYYSGTREDKMNCLSWLEKVSQACTAAGLTQNASCDLLERYSQGEVAGELAASRRQGLGFESMVRKLEVRFAGMTTPDEARRLCRDATRMRGESLPAFGTRIYNMAWLAYRDRHDHRDRLATTLAKDVFTSEMSPSARNQMSNSETNHLSSGHPPWTYTEYVGRAATIEADMKPKEHGRHPARMAYVGMDPEEGGDPEDLPFHQSENVRRAGARPADYGDRSLAGTQSQVGSANGVDQREQENHLRILVQRVENLQSLKKEADSQQMSQLLQAQDRQFQLQDKQFCAQDRHADRMEDWMRNLYHIAEVRANEVRAPPAPVIVQTTHPGYGKPPVLQYDTQPHVSAVSLTNKQDGQGQRQMDYTRFRSQSPGQGGQGGYRNASPYGNANRAQSPHQQQAVSFAGNDQGGYERGRPPMRSDQGANDRGSYRPGQDSRGYGQNRGYNNNYNYRQGPNDNRRQPSPYAGPNDRRSREDNRYNDQGGDNRYRQRSLSGSRRDPRIYHVLPDECMKCGQKGHGMWQKDCCPMYSLGITDGPCPKCMRGGHLEEHCLLQLPSKN